ILRVFAAEDHVLQVRAEDMGEFRNIELSRCINQCGRSLLWCVKTPSALRRALTRGRSWCLVRRRLLSDAAGREKKEQHEHADHKASPVMPCIGKCLFHLLLLSAPDSSSDLVTYAVRHHRDCHRRHGCPPRLRPGIPCWTNRGCCSSEHWTRYSLA